MLKYCRKFHNEERLNASLMNFKLVRNRNAVVGGVSFGWSIGTGKFRAA